MPKNKKWSHCTRLELLARNAAIIADYNAGMEIIDLSKKYTLKQNTLYMLIANAGIATRKKYMQHGINQGVKSVSDSDEDELPTDIDPALCQHAVHDISVPHVILTDKASKVIKKHYIDVTELYLQSNECITGINQ